MMYGGYWIVIRRPWWMNCNRLIIRGNDSSLVATDEISPITIGEMQLCRHHIDIYHSIQIPDLKSFPVDDFFRVPSSHQIDL